MLNAYFLPLASNCRLIEEHVYPIHMGWSSCENLIHAGIVAENFASSSRHVRIPACNVGKNLEDAERSFILVEPAEARTRAARLFRGWIKDEARV